MIKTFFTADTHFNQERTIKFSKRPFSTLEEMNKTMITNWNNVVSDNDTVYHLGDFGDPMYAKYLNGTIIIVPGNYDDYKVLGILKEIKGNKFRIIEKDTTIVFDNDKRYNLIHEPFLASFDEFTLYGHIHGQKFKRKGFNVGVDCNYFRPVELSDIHFFRDAVLNYYDENVFMDPVLPFKCYIDMDGVLADIISSICEGLKIDNPYDDPKNYGYDDLTKIPGLDVTKKEIFATMETYEFWTDMKVLPNAKTIVNTALERYGSENVTILTSATSKSVSLAGKFDWIKKKFPKIKNFIISVNKGFCSASNHILLDDRIHVVDNFIAHGGKSILVPALHNSRHEDYNRYFKGENIEVRDYLIEKMKKVENVYK